MSVEHRRGRTWPQDGGETGALIRALDWSTAPLGVPASWPGVLRSTVDLILRTPVPMALGWGPRGFLLGNDAAAALTGTSASDLVGNRLEEVWSELARDAADPLGAALAGGTTELRGLALVSWH